MALTYNVISFGWRLATFSRVVTLSFAVNLISVVLSSFGNETEKDEDDDKGDYDGQQTQPDECNNTHHVGPVGPAERGPRC